MNSMATKVQHFRSEEEPIDLMIRIIRKTEKSTKPTFTNKCTGGPNIFKNENKSGPTSRIVWMVADINSKLYHHQEVGEERISQ